MRRITVSEVERAYEVTGIDRETGDYCSRENCGCPLTALYLAENPGKETIQVIENPSVVIRWGVSEFGYEYRAGFVGGVDGIVYSREDRQRDPARYDAGYADGVAVRQALFPNPPLAVKG